MSSILDLGLVIAVLTMSGKLQIVPTETFSSHFYVTIHKDSIQYCLNYMSRDMRIPTIWDVRPENAQTSLRIRAV